MAQWYAQVSGQRFGPVSDEEMKSWIAQGRVKPTDYVWSEGMANWVTAASAFPVSGGPAAPGAVQPVQAVPYAGGQLPNAPGAVTAMVCGIIGCALGCSSIVALVLGIVALKQSKSAKQAIAQNPGVYGGEGMATAGMITGIVAICFGSLSTLYWIAYITCLGTILGTAIHSSRSSGF